MSTYSQKREQAYDLRAWLASNTRVLCCGALEKPAGEIPACSISKEKPRTGLQPTPTSSKNTVFSEMPNMLVTKTFVLCFHHQNTQWAVAKGFSRAFCFRLTGWFALEGKWTGPDIFSGFKATTAESREFCQSYKGNYHLAHFCSFHQFGLHTMTPCLAQNNVSKVLHTFYFLSCLGFSRHIQVSCAKAFPGRFSCPCSFH